MGGAPVLRDQVVRAVNRAEIVVTKDGLYYGLSIECPGCEFGHHVVATDWTPEGKQRFERPAEACWGFNGDLVLPTLTPSILCRVEMGAEKRKVVCHSFVTGGRIQFLNDCTHALAGQTVDLPEIEP